MSQMNQAEYERQLEAFFEQFEGIDSLPEGHLVFQMDFSGTLTPEGLYVADHMMHAEFNADSWMISSQAIDFDAHNVLLKGEDYGLPESMTDDSVMELEAHFTVELDWHNDELTLIAFDGDISSNMFMCVIEPNIDMLLAA